MASKRRLRKFRSGSEGNTRISQLVLLTSCTPRDLLEDVRRELKIRSALLAERRFPVRRYGKTARAA